MRKKRLDLKLLQKDVAQKLGVNKTTLYNWENNRASPSLYQVAKIIKFLRYIPDSIQANTFGEKVVLSRHLLGITQKKLAHCLGIDPTTLSRWERDKTRPPKKHLERLNTLFASLSSGGGGVCELFIYL
jgi:transcriptional regulator with XRE-family HTH domain